MSALHRIAAIIRKEFIQISRDPKTLAIVLVMPLMQLILLGYAINTVVDHIPTVVSDRSPSERSRSLVEAFTTTSYFRIAGYVDGPAEARRAVDRGEAKAAIIIPPDYTTNVQAGRPGQVQVLIDGSDPNIAQTALLSADAVARSRSTELLATNLQRAGSARGLTLPIDLRPTVLYNPSMQSVNFMIPGLIGLILQMQGLMLTAFAVVRERESGTLEQLVVTPIKPWELMLGKILPYTAIAFVGVGVVITAGWLVFGVEVAGSVLLLLGISLIFLLGALGVGLLISTVSTTQTQALMMSFMFMLPAMILSGFMFPREAMPPIIYYLGYLVPLTYFLEVMRGIVLKGSELGDLLNQVGLLTLYGVVVFAASATRFRKSLG